MEKNTQKENVVIFKEGVESYMSLQIIAAMPMTNKRFVEEIQGGKFLETQKIEKGVMFDNKEGLIRWLPEMAFKSKYQKINDNTIMVQKQHPKIQVKKD